LDGIPIVELTGFIKARFGDICTGGCICCIGICGCCTGAEGIFGEADTGIICMEGPCACSGKALIAILANKLITTKPTPYEINAQKIAKSQKGITV
jgi:hypothetical protein